MGRKESPNYDHHYFNPALAALIFLFVKYEWIHVLTSTREQTEYYYSGVISISANAY